MNKSRAYISLLVMTAFCASVTTLELDLLSTKTRYDSIGFCI